MSSRSSSGVSVRRFLSFDELPYRGKRFYLDVKKAADKNKLAQQIVYLGGTVEDFLSKELSLIVTDRESEKADSSKPVKAQIPLSRGQALLKASQHQGPKDGHVQDFLQSAANLGVKTQKASTFIRATSKLYSKIKTQRKTGNENDLLEGMSHISWDKDKENLCIVKVEDNENIYRPLFKQFESFPEVDYSQPGSPFDVGVVLKREGKENNQAKKKSAGAGVVKGGFCESCDHWYKCSLREHLKSDKHRAFVKSVDNFRSLDDLVVSLPNLKKFLGKNGLECESDSQIESKTSDNALITRLHGDVASSNGPCFSQVEYPVSFSEAKDKQSSNTKLPHYVSSHPKVGNLPKTAEPHHLSQWVSERNLFDQFEKTASKCTSESISERNNIDQYAKAKCTSESNSEKVLSKTDNTVSSERRFTLNEVLHDVFDVDNVADDSFDDENKENCDFAQLKNTNNAFEQLGQASKEQRINRDTKPASSDHCASLSNVLQNSGFLRHVPEASFSSSCSFGDNGIRNIISYLQNDSNNTRSSFHEKNDVSGKCSDTEDKKSLSGCSDKSRLTASLFTRPEFHSGCMNDDVVNFRTSSSQNGSDARKPASIASQCSYSGQSRRNENDDTINFATSFRQNGSNKSAAASIASQCSYSNQSRGNENDETINFATNFRQNGSNNSAAASIASHCSYSSQSRGNENDDTINFATYFRQNGSSKAASGIVGSESSHSSHPRGGDSNASSHHSSLTAIADGSDSNLSRSGDSRDPLRHIFHMDSDSNPSRPGSQDFRIPSQHNSHLDNESRGAESFIQCFDELPNVLSELSSTIRYPLSGHTSVVNLSKPASARGDSDLNSLNSLDCKPTNGGSVSHDSSRNNTTNLHTQITTSDEKVETPEKLGKTLMCNDETPTRKSMSFIQPSLEDLCKSGSSIRNWLIPKEDDEISVKTVVSKLDNTLIDMDNSPMPHIGANPDSDLNGAKDRTCDAHNDLPKSTNTGVCDLVANWIQTQEFDHDHSVASGSIPDGIVGKVGSCDSGYEQDGSLPQSERHFRLSHEGSFKQSETKSSHEGSLKQSEPHYSHEDSLKQSEPHFSHEGSLKLSEPHFSHEGSLKLSEPHFSHEGSLKLSEPHFSHEGSLKLSEPHFSHKGSLKLGGPHSGTECGSLSLRPPSKSGVNIDGNTGDAATSLTGDGLSGKADGKWTDTCSYTSISDCTVFSDIDTTQQAENTGGCVVDGDNDKWHNTHLSVNRTAENGSIKSAFEKDSMLVGEPSLNRGLEHNEMLGRRQFDPHNSNTILSLEANVNARPDSAKNEPFSGAYRQYSDSSAVMSDRFTGNSDNNSYDRSVKNGDNNSFVDFSSKRSTSTGDKNSNTAGHGKALVPSDDQSTASSQITMEKEVSKKSTKQKAARKPGPAKKAETKKAETKKKLSKPKQNKKSLGKAVTIAQQQLMTAQMLPQSPTTWQNPFMAQLMYSPISLPSENAPVDPASPYGQQQMWHQQNSGFPSSQPQSQTFSPAFQSTQLESRPFSPALSLQSQNRAFSPALIDSNNGQVQLGFSQPYSPANSSYSQQVPSAIPTAAPVTRSFSPQISGANPVPIASAYSQQATPSQQASASQSMAPSLHMALNQQMTPNQHIAPGYNPYQQTLAVDTSYKPTEMLDLLASPITQCHSPYSVHQQQTVTNQQSPSQNCVGISNYNYGAIENSNQNQYSGFQYPNSSQFSMTADSPFAETVNGSGSYIPQTYQVGSYSGHSVPSPGFQPNQPSNGSLSTICLTDIAEDASSNSMYSDSSRYVARPKRKNNSVSNNAQLSKQSDLVQQSDRTLHIGSKTDSSVPLNFYNNVQPVGAMTTFSTSYDQSYNSETNYQYSAQSHGSTQYGAYSVDSHMQGSTQNSTHSMTTNLQTGGTSVYNAVQTGDMKIRLCKKQAPQSSHIQEPKSTLPHYWNVRKTGECRLVFSASLVGGKRKAGETPSQRDFLQQQQPASVQSPYEPETDLDQQQAKRRRCLVF